MNDQPLLETVSAIHESCRVAKHRRQIVLAGDRQWSRLQAGSIISLLQGDWCWLGDQADDGVTTVSVDKAHSLLGSEWDGVVYDACSGFDPNAYGAITGTLRGGGLLLLLTPALDEWADYPDPQRARIMVYPYSENDVGKRFLRRLAALLSNAPECLVIEQQQPLPVLQQRDDNPESVTVTEGVCASADQAKAVELLWHLARGHRRRPCVLVSDRGRGKSAALGIAAAQLLLGGLRRIVVTAPRLAAVQSLFLHAAQLLVPAKSGRGRLEADNGAVLFFMPPDQLLREEIDCELLLVDEAAAIPGQLLERLLHRYSRIAFATTVHGYEGTGRGFDLRFRRVLDDQAPGWKRLTMNQPIRWAEGDPLERLVFRSLLLDAEPASDEVVAQIPFSECSIEWVDRDRLITDETVLSQLFGLLVLAHYRTSPADLRNLLDGPNLQVCVLHYRGTVLGCVLAAVEGGFDEALSQQVYAGERRLRGNLLAQSLTVHAGIRSAASLKGMRVMRIAVHPARQGEGLGSRLVGAVHAQAVALQADYLGASFGATDELLDFWRRNDCLPVRLGLKREASSGTYSAMVMQPLSGAGKQLFADARSRLMMQFPLLLSEPLCELEPSLVERVITAGGEVPSELNPSDALDAASFAFNNRDYGNCLTALHTLLWHALVDGLAASSLSPPQRTLLIAKVLQRRPWSELVHEYGFSGKDELLRRMRDAYGVLCGVYGFV